MATTEVNICNMALANIGRAPIVTSLRPPDSSQEAQTCYQFYDTALATVIDSHNWGFVTRQAIPAPVANPSALWAYAYSIPSNFVNLIAVYNSSAIGDVTLGYENPSITSGAASFIPISTDSPLWMMSSPTQESYSLESDNEGNYVLYTNEASPLIKYSVYPENIGAFPPLFVEAFTWKLSASLAGALIRDDVGVAAAKSCIQAYASWVSKAIESDCQNRHESAKFVPSFIGSRYR